MNFNEMLTAASICVILPVLIVWIVTRARQNAINKKSEIMLKAIEAGVPVNADLLTNKKKARTIKQDLMERLTGSLITTLMGVAFLILYFVGGSQAEPYFMSRFYPVAGVVMVAVGIGLAISFFVGKKMLAKEIEAEENALDTPRE